MMHGDFGLMYYVSMITCFSIMHIMSGHDKYWIHVNRHVFDDLTSQITLVNHLVAPYHDCELNHIIVYQMIIM